MATINQSLEWSPLQHKLTGQAVRVDDRNYLQLMMIISSIGRMVTELSKEEVNCRRLRRQTPKHKEILEKVNKEIARCEQMITFAVLLKG